MNVILEIVQYEYASRYIYTYMCLYRYIASPSIAQKSVHCF